MTKNGVSLVLVNTEKGKDYFDLIKDRLEIIESDYEKASAMNSNLVVASERPACRDTIYDGFDGLDFDSYVKTKLAFKVNPKTKIKKNDTSRRKEGTEKNCIKQNRKERK